MANSDSLNIYREKRNFNRTVEPIGTFSEGTRENIFVIQKHSASTLHYDFRIEADGVLKSWAVPKGPSLNPKVKRLAVMTEDHPLDYAAFEGIIPEGEYGGGKVIVWDSGTYSNKSIKNGEELDINQALDKGHIIIELQGSKINGKFALIRTSGGSKSQWLLMKMKDTYDSAEDLTIKQPKSVISGLTIEELK